MRLSTRGEYGVKAMIDLALHYGEGPTALKSVAERQFISEHYLEQLIASLRKAGLVTSVRGAQGGYELARPPGEITVGDVVRVLEGPIAPVECVDESQEFSNCTHSESCVTRIVWKRLRDSITQVLDSTTLADLSEEARKMQAREAPPMYYI